MGVKKNRFHFFMAALVLLMIQVTSLNFANSQSLSADNKEADRLSKVSSPQIDWMLENLIRDTEGGPGKLERSWGTDVKFSFATPYAQALSIMVYAKKGYLKEAKAILRELEYLQKSDGSWHFIYNTSNPGQENESRKLGAQASWVVMAINYYTYLTDDTLYIDMAVNAMNWVLSKLQDTNDGGIRGGVNADGTLVKWKSSEHNVDAYSALTHLSAILHKYKKYPSLQSIYSRAANQVKKFIEIYLWNEEEGRFIRGQGDPYTTITPSMWGVLSLGTKSSDGSKNYTRALDFIEKTFKFTENNITGFDSNFDPNSDYDENESFTSGGKHTGDGLDTVWSEATLGVVVANYMVGRKETGDFYLKEMAKFIDPVSGGIKYSTTPGSYSEYYSSNGGSTDQTEKTVTGTSTASTTWYIMAQDNFNPFKPFDIELKKGIYVLKSK